MTQPATTRLPAVRALPDHGPDTSTTRAALIGGVLGLVTHLARSLRDRPPAIAIRDVEGAPT